MIFQAFSIKTILANKWFDKRQLNNKLKLF